MTVSYLIIDSGSRITNADFNERGLPNVHSELFAANADIVMVQAVNPVAYTVAEPAYQQGQQADRG